MLSIIRAVLLPDPIHVFNQVNPNRRLVLPWAFLVASILSSNSL